MTAIRWQPEWRWIGAVAALLVFAAGCGLGGKPGTDAGPVDDADATSGGGRWEPISTAGAPSPRIWHTAVWTGEGMIVWGGNDTAPGRLDTGGRYDPVTDTWSPTSLDGAPAPRTGHGAVWTGSEMIVWGGWDGFSLYSDGARYDPLTDTWTPMSDTGAPEPRGVGDRAVWTGDDLIVWGGRLPARRDRGWTPEAATTHRPIPGRPPPRQAHRTPGQATPRSGPGAR